MTDIVIKRPNEADIPAQMTPVQTGKALKVWLFVGGRTTAYVFKQINEVEFKFVAHTTNFDQLCDIEDRINKEES